MNFQDKFQQGLSYADFLIQYARGQQQADWQGVLQAITLKEDQITKLKSFKRTMKVMVLAGAWCGDCVNQCPIFQHFADASPAIHLRYFDRDDHRDLGDPYRICGGNRVPTVVFLSEDDQVCGIYGDRTLAKYRQLADQLAGASCPVGFGTVDQILLGQVIEDWLNEFERIQLMLRFSARLRELHGD